MTFLILGYLPSSLCQVQPHFLSLAPSRLLCTREGQTCSNVRPTSFSEALGHTVPRTLSTEVAAHLQEAGDLGGGSSARGHCLLLMLPSIPVLLPSSAQALIHLCFQPPPYLPQSSFSKLVIYSALAKQGRMGFTRAEEKSTPALMFPPGFLLTE